MRKEHFNRSVSFSRRHHAVSRLPIGRWCRSSTSDLNHPFNNLNPVSLGCSSSSGITSPLSALFFSLSYETGERSTQSQPIPISGFLLWPNPHPSSIREQLIIAERWVSLSLHYHLTLWFTVIYTEVCEGGFIIQMEQLPSLLNTRIDNTGSKLASVRFQFSWEFKSYFCLNLSLYSVRYWALKQPKCQRNSSQQSDFVLHSYQLYYIVQHFLMLLFW